MTKYEALPGQNIEECAEEATKIAKKSGIPASFDFNGVKLTAMPHLSIAQNKKEMRQALGLPEIEPPFHPQTAADALNRWDDGKLVFTIEMGGLGPEYEQAIQVLVFEIIRDSLNVTLPDESDKDKMKTFSASFGDSAVSRIDEKMGGYSGAMIGAAKYLAYRALRDGWEKTLKSAPDERRIQVSKDFPKL